MIFRRCSGGISTFCGWTNVPTFERVSVKRFFCSCSHFLFLISKSFLLNLDGGLGIDDEGGGGGGGALPLKPGGGGGGGSPFDEVPFPLVDDGGGGGGGGCHPGGGGKLLIVYMV